MPLALSVALIVLGAIVLIGLVGYWIDEAVEPPNAHEPTSGEQPLGAAKPKPTGAGRTDVAGRRSAITRSSL